MSVSRRSAFTLVEMVVYCGLLSIFAAVFLVSLPSKENTSLENLSYSAEQSGLVLAKIHRDISNSLARLTEFTEEAGLAMPSALESPDSEYSYGEGGELLWRSWVVYQNRDRTLNRFEYPFKQVVTSTQIDPLESLTKLSRGGVRLMASDVAEFEVERENDAFRVTLTIDVQGERVRNVTAMAPRN